MTIIQIANFVQRDERTVRRWIEKAERKLPTLADKMSGSGHGVSVDFSIDEVEAILRSSSLSKDAVSILMENARGTKAPQIISNDLLDVIGRVVTTTVTAVMDQFDGKFKQLESKLISNQPKALPPAPKKDSRAHITEVVRNYAAATRLPYNEVYSMLYTEFGYRTHSNPGRCAMNRNMKIIDYVEQEGRIEELEAVAVEFLVPPEKFVVGYLPE